MKSHLQSYPCPLQINSFWNLGFLLGITIILQIITGILLGLHYCSDLYSAYSSIFFFIREIYYGWCLRYLHSCGASFVFLFLFLHLGRAISYASYFYNPNTWFSGILLLFFLMALVSNPGLDRATIPRPVRKTRPRKVWRWDITYISSFLVPHSITGWPTVGGSFITLSARSYQRLESYLEGWTGG